MYCGLLLKQIFHSFPNTPFLRKIHYHVNSPPHIYTMTIVTAKINNITYFFKIGTTRSAICNR